MPIAPDVLDSLKRRLTMAAGDLVRDEPPPPVTFYIVQYYEVPLGLGWMEMPSGFFETKAAARKELRRVSELKFVKKSTDRPLRIVKRTVTITEKVVT